MRNKTLIAGPCVLEETLINLDIASTCKEIADKYGFSYIFKASYSKANRTSHTSYRGPGVRKGLAALRDVKKQGQCVITTDIHEIAELGEFESAQPWVDVIQIPAFLSRQTDLLMEAAITAVRTDAIVNIKKGQFMTHKDAQAAIDKVRHHGAACWITERGNCFGYSDVVIDPCNFVPYANAHLIADCTHTNRGNIENTIMLARAALACGVDGLFMETTIMPSRAHCDGDKMIPLHRLEETIKQIREGLENV